MSRDGHDTPRPSPDWVRNEIRNEALASVIIGLVITVVVYLRSPDPLFDSLVVGVAALLLAPVRFVLARVGLRRYGPSPLRWRLISYLIVVIAVSIAAWPLDVWVGRVQGLPVLVMFNVALPYAAYILGPQLSRRFQR